MRHELQVGLAFTATFPTRSFAHAGFSDSNPTFMDGWLIVTAVYSPLAIILAGIIGLSAAILFGRRIDNRVKPSGRAALVSVAISVGIYCVGTAILVFIKG